MRFTRLLDRRNLFFNSAFAEYLSSCCDWWSDVSLTLQAEQEFQEHLNSLKIKLEDGETRSMVERRGRDVSGKWIYLCYPCAAVCSGESILQVISLLYVFIQDKR